MVDYLVYQESLTENIKTNTHSYMITILRMSSRRSKWLPKEEFIMKELEKNINLFGCIIVLKVTRSLEGFYQIKSFLHLPMKANPAPSSIHWMA